MKKELLADWLEHQLELYNHSGFIESDPISIPHQFSKREDIEIAGFFAAIFSWGQRITIINKSKKLMELMDNSPHEFILHHSDQDLKPLANFVHRTFNGTDLLYFVEKLKNIYQKHGSLEVAFSKHQKKGDETIENALIGFHKNFFDLEFAPKRSQKHIASPARKSTCKRLCMYFRWMVRNDDVDFGIWKSISPAQLLMPYDVHVERIAKRLKLVKRKQKDWLAVLELTKSLRKFDATDPVKYDYALFGAGVSNI